MATFSRSSTSPHGVSSPTPQLRALPTRVRASGKRRNWDVDERVENTRKGERSEAQVARSAASCICGGAMGFLGDTRFSRRDTALVVESGAQLITRTRGRWRHLEQALRSLWEDGETWSAESPSGGSSFPSVTPPFSHADSPLWAICPPSHHRARWWRAPSGAASKRSVGSGSGARLNVVSDRRCWRSNSPKLHIDVAKPTFT